MRTPTFDPSGDETEIEDEYTSRRVCETTVQIFPPATGYQSLLDSPESLPSPPLIPTPYTQQLQLNSKEKFAAVSEYFNHPSDSEMDFEVNTKKPSYSHPSQFSEVNVCNSQLPQEDSTVLHSQTMLNSTALLSPTSQQG